MAQELKEYLTRIGVATSRTTPYNPQGNGQVERYNGIIWKTINLSLKSRNLPTERWEEVLPVSLHAVRSLLCTATNETPHERMFKHPRRSTSGTSIPTWLTSPGTVLLKKHVRGSKYDPLVEEVELLECNPDYAHVRYPDGRETTVSVRHLAPRGTESQGHSEQASRPDQSHDQDEDESLPEPPEEAAQSTLDLTPPSPPGMNTPRSPDQNPTSPSSPTVRPESETTTEVRRSTRTRRKPDYLKDYYLSK